MNLNPPYDFRQSCSRTVRAQSILLVQTLPMTYFDRLCRLRIRRGPNIHVLYSVYPSFMAPPAADQCGSELQPAAADDDGDGTGGMYSIRQEVTLIRSEHPTLLIIPRQRAITPTTVLQCYCAHPSRYSWTLLTHCQLLLVRCGILLEGHETHTFASPIILMLSFPIAYWEFVRLLSNSNEYCICR